MSEKTEATVASEFRVAAARLRCEHSFPVQPPHGSLFAPGPCSGCGMPWDARIDIADQLREPLAALLDDAAEEAEVRNAEEVTLGPDETYDKAVVDYRHEIRANLTHVLAVARVISQPSSAALPLGEEAEPGDVWKVSDNTVPIGGVSPKSFVSHSGWNGGHPVEIVEIEDSTRAHGVTFVAWRDVRKPEGRSTVVRVPSDMQVAPCTLNDTPTP